MKRPSTARELCAEYDRLKGPGASKGLSIHALCQGIAQATGRTLKPAPVEKPSLAAASQAARMPEYLSLDEEASLSIAERMERDQQYAACLSQEIRASGHRPESKPPGDHIHGDKLPSLWSGHVRVLAAQCLKISATAKSAPGEESPAAHIQKPAATKAGEAFRQASDL